MHALVRDIAGFSELVGRKKSLLPDLGTRISVSLGCWNGLVGCVTSALLWLEKGFFFYLASAYGIGILNMVK